MSKNKIKNEKAITLIALIVTIIVLLILAGVSIAVLTGDNSILRRSSEAKITTKIAEIEEQANLIYTSELIGKLSASTGSRNVELSTVCTELQDEKYGYTIEQKTTGTPVIEAVTIAPSSIGILKGQSGQITATVTTTSATGSWYAVVEGKYYRIYIPEGKKQIKVDKTETDVSGAGGAPAVTFEISNNKVTVEKANTSTTDNTYNVLVASDVTGTSATITASAGEGAGKVSSAPCTVTFLTQATGITATPNSISIGKGESITIGTETTSDIKITTTPETNVAPLTYTYSSNSSNVSVSSAGVVTGNEVTGSTPATITITGTKSDSTTVTTTLSVTVTPALGKFKTENGVAYYYSPGATTGTPITESNMEQYLAKKVDYTQGGTYRIFYVDVNNKYGNGAGTIYLKADYNSSRTMGLDSYSSYDTSTTKVREMNPTWRDGVTSGTVTTTRGNNESNWNKNEQAAAYLCTPTNSANATTGLWKDYFDGFKANWVIGSPSAEMYCDSYTKASHTGTGVTGNYSFEAVYSASNRPGYKYRYTDLSVANATPVTEYYTPYEGNGSLDYSTKYNNMYCGLNGAKTGNWWLASPSSLADNGVCSVIGNNAYLHNLNCVSTLGVCPLVALKSDIFVNEIEE